MVKKKKDSLMKIPPVLKDVVLGGTSASSRGMGGPDEWEELITVFKELTGITNPDPNPKAFPAIKIITPGVTISEDSGGGRPAAHTATGKAVACEAATDSASASSASARSATASSASASAASAAAVTEFPDAATYIDDVLEADLDYNPSDVDIPSAAARTAILNATRSMAEINFRREMRSLSLASIYGAARGTLAKYRTALTKLGQAIESGIVAGEHEYLQAKIAEAQVKANIVSPKLSARATVISSVISDRMRGRATNAQLATEISDSNAKLTTGVSERNAALGTGVSERNAQLGTGVSETNAKLATDVSGRNAELATRVSERNASLCTDASIANANNMAKITDSLNNFYASLYSSEKRVLQSGLGSLLGSIANQCGRPGMSWIEVT